MLRNQDRSPSFSLSLLTGWLCRTIRQSLFARRNASAAIFAMVAPASNLRIAAIRSIARITAFANAPGTVPVLPVCQCGTTLAECFRCQFALVGGVPTASVVKITALANAPIDCAIFAVFSGELVTYTSRLFTRAQSEPQFFAPSGVDHHIKKVRSSLSRLAGPGQSTVGFANHTVSSGNCPVPIGNRGRISAESEIPTPQNQLSKG